MFDVIKKYKEIRVYYLLATVCVIIDVILGSTILKGCNMLDVSMTGGGGIVMPIILILVITFVVFKVPNSINDIGWQWIKTLLIIIIPFWFVFYMMFFDMLSNTGSDFKAIVFLVYELISIISIIFTIIARKNYRKTEEFKNKQNKKNKKREKFELELAQIRVESAMKKQQKMQKKEDQEYLNWLNYHEDLISRGMKYYRVSFANNKKYFGGRIAPRFYVEAIDKDASIVEARKIAGHEIGKYSITECVVIAGSKNINYDEIADKWKDRRHLGYYSKV